jgi:hypothetical protein
VGHDTATTYRTYLYLAASATAEFVADTALCPFEATKVRMQTSPPSAGFPTAFGEAWSKIVSTEGANGCGAGSLAAAREWVALHRPASFCSADTQPVQGHRAAVGSPGTLYRC